jgi:uncharacterized protein with ParB-like and HNH nuclease domain
VHFEEIWQSKAQFFNSRGSRQSKAGLRKRRCNGGNDETRSHLSYAEDFQVNRRCASNKSTPTHSRMGYIASNKHLSDNIQITSDITTQENTGMLSGFALAYKVT